MLHCQIVWKTTLMIMTSRSQGMPSFWRIWTKTTREQPVELSTWLLWLALSRGMSMWWREGSGVKWKANWRMSSQCCSQLWPKQKKASKISRMMWKRVLCKVAWLQIQTLQHFIELNHDGHHGLSYGYFMGWFGKLALHSSKDFPKQQYFNWHSGLPHSCAWKNDQKLKMPRSRKWFISLRAKILLSISLSSFIV